MVTWIVIYKWHRYYALPTLKDYLSDHPFIKDIIFEATLNFTPRYNPIVIVFQYCKHQTMSYVYQSTNKIPWNREFPARNRTNL